MAGSSVDADGKEIMARVSVLWELDAHNAGMICSLKKVHTIPVNEDGWQPQFNAIAETVLDDE